MLLGLIRFDWVFLGFTGFYRVLLGFTGCYWVWLGLTGFDWVLPSFTGFYRVLLNFTGFYRVLPSFTGFYRVLLNFTGFYRVLPGFTGVYWVLLGLSGCYWVWLGCTGFFIGLSVSIGFRCRPRRRRFDRSNECRGNKIETNQRESERIEPRGRPSDWFRVFDCVVPSIKNEQGRFGFLSLKQSPRLYLVLLGFTGFYLFFFSWF